MPTLYDLGVEYARLETLLIEQAGEWTDETEAAFEALGELERVKVDAYEGVIANLAGHAAACQDEAQRLQEKADAALNAAKRLKARLLEYMQARDVMELKGEKWRACIQKNGGKRPIVLLCAPDALPISVQRVRVEADMEALRTALEAVARAETPTLPIEIAGVARLEPMGVHLRFR